MTAAEKRRWCQTHCDRWGRVAGGNACRTLLHPLGPGCFVYAGDEKRREEREAEETACGTAGDRL